MSAPDLSIILAYGIGVFPCRAKPEGDRESKSPLTEHGLKDASTDPKQIAEWAREHGRCAWGAAMTAEIGAIDIDVKKGTSGFDSLAEILGERGNLPRTLTNNTPSGGQHRLFRFGKALSNSVGKVAPGIDIRSKGGYIVIPPSVIDTGAYSWEDRAQQIALPPDWLVPEIEKRAGASRPSRHVPDGKRNKTMFAFACGLRARNVPEAEAWEALQLRNLDCDPPLAEAELRHHFQSAWRYPPGFNLTDLGNAERLVAQHGNDWRFLPEVGWCHFDGVRWADDSEGRITVAAADTIRGLYTESAAEDDDVRRRKLSAHAIKSESRRAIEAMVALARSRPEVVDLLERYDTQPYLLATRNGVLDLETGQFREGRREDRLRLRADVECDPKATAPRFEKFLEEIFAGDAELITFMARALGYSACGSNAEQVIFIAHGAGANGKSTLMNVVRHLLGDYAKAIQAESLMARERGGINNDIARIRAVRFGPGGEIEDGKKMAESMVKQTTGGDAISARFLHKEFFDFVPVIKFWISTNHRPVISGTDHAIWRRIILVPFTVTIPPEQQDKDLEQKLLAECPGILNWIAAGFREWRVTGLAPPKSVLAATNQYRLDMDRIGMFLKERTRQGAGRTKCSEVYAAYTAWCGATGVRPFSRPRFREKAVNEHALTVVTANGYELFDSLLLVIDGLEDL